jgi:hypothetical protein
MDNFFSKVGFFEFLTISVLPISFHKPLSIIKQKINGFGDVPANELTNKKFE